MGDTIDRARENIEHAHHQQVGHGDEHTRRVAVLIAVTAAALALAEMAVKSAENDYLTQHIMVSDDWGFFQAKNARATMRAAEIEILESLPGASEPAIGRRIEQTRELEQRLRDDPVSGEGVKQLRGRAEHHAELRDHALHLYHRFELIVGALQIAIVLPSVSLVTRAVWLAWAGGALGAAASLAGILAWSGVL
ncbi:MAG: DUF4337 family protein [Acetobacteraceae bacterium]|nr:DUF4337 family protein [Acetobacteraceae bacterium]MBV8591385.1 DUF4337 family protein [Acetobacteraceae bacterium]